MNYRILMVEDDFALAKIMKQQIELWGNEVSLVTDFQNVLSTFLEYDPQLVLMDIKLPFLTVITGAAKSVKYPMSPSSLFPLQRII